MRGARLLLPFLLVAGLAQAACASFPAAEVTPRAYVPVVTRQALTPLPASLVEVDDFVYQLQNLDLVAMGSTAYDLVVIDYAADGSAETEFTAAQSTPCATALAARRLSWPI